MNVVEEWDAVIPQWQAMQAVMKTQVRVLGDRIGFGNMMGLARDCWRDHLVASGAPSGGEFAVGPCTVMTVPCGCKGGCDWCEGCGWLTKKVKALKEKGRR